MLADSRVSQRSFRMAVQQNYEVPIAKSMPIAGFNPPKPVWAADITDIGCLFFMPALTSLNNKSADGLGDSI